MTRTGSLEMKLSTPLSRRWENQRDDTVVIFAGYPDKMEQFLKKNPGLRSRIAFHIPFEDYKPAELLDIFTLMAKKQKLKLAPLVRERLLPIFSLATKQPDFGNGRFGPESAGKIPDETGQPPGALGSGHSDYGDGFHLDSGGY